MAEMNPPQRIRHIHELNLVFKGLTEEMLLCIYFFDDPNDTIRKEMNAIATSTTTPCVFREVLLTDVRTPELLEKYYPLDPQTSTPVLAFFDKDRKRVNLLNDLIFHAFKIGI